jgi:tetratricopeptide (TPR) repeat protein
MTRSKTCLVALVFAFGLGAAVPAAFAQPAKGPKGAPAKKVKATKDDKAKAKKADKAKKTDKAKKDDKIPGTDPALMLRKKAQEPAALASGRSISLLRGATALSADFRVYAELATAYQRAGQFDLAAHEFRRYATMEPDRARADAALTKAKEVDEQPRGFGEGGFRALPASAEAEWAFKEGQKRFKAKKFKEAVSYFQAAMLLDPGVPGPYRMLGAAYGKAGEREKESRFFIEYLRVRPDGNIAEEIRKLLAKTGQLGYLTIESSYPCDIVVNGRELQGKLTPLKKLAVPPGGYSISLGSDGLHGQWNLRDRVVVEPGKEATFKLPLGILAVKVTPWARISVDGKYVGSYEEVGLRTGDYRIHLESSDGAKQKDLTVSIQAGQKYTVDKW